MELDQFDLFANNFYAQKTELSLRQGDLISLKTFKEKYQDIKDETPLDKLYPYFFNNYKYAVVSSQCCDINKSNSKFKVGCVQLLAVKEWIVVLRDWLKEKEHIASEENGIITIKKNKPAIKETIKEITNFINHNTHTNFYYPAKKDILITDYSACADIPISLKIKNIYDCLIESRVTSINKEYRHKLSNFLGNLYFRIGMDEFKEITNIDSGKLEDVIKSRHAKLGLKLES